MSTFGGHTIPTLFTGKDAIFLKSVGNSIQYDVINGSPTQLIPKPANVAIGDLLIAVAYSGGSAISPAAGSGVWSIDSLFAGGAIELRSRLATNNANDDYFIINKAANNGTLDYFAVMLCIGNSLGMTVTPIQSGLQGPTPGAIYDIPAMNAGPNPNNTFTLAVYNRFYSLGSIPNPTVTDTTGLTNIFTEVHKIVTFLEYTMQSGLSFQFQKTSAAFPLVSIGYTPFGVVQGNNRTKYVRYGLI